MWVFRSFLFCYLCIIVVWKVSFVSLAFRRGEVIYVLSESRLGKRIFCVRKSLVGFSHVF